MKKGIWKQYYSPGRQIRRAKRRRARYAAPRARKRICLEILESME